MHRTSPALRALATLLGCALLLAESASAQLTFVDLGISFGVAGNSFGRGAGMADLDGDGMLDLVAFDDSTPSKVYQQGPPGAFSDVGASWGIPVDTAHTWGGLIADFDNDGDADIYEFNGGYYFPEPNDLFRNDLATLGTFTDVSSAAGDVARSEQNFGATAVDFDRDGLLDIFQSTAGELTPPTLLRNTGGLVFVDVAPSAGLTRLADFRHCGSGDVDNDGWIDLGVGESSFTPSLFHNQRDGTFVDIAESGGILTVASNFGMLFSDVDNDGWMDVVVPKYQWLSVTTATRLYMNNGDLTFTDVSTQVGLLGQEDMGHDIGDLDADGYPELYIGTGQPSKPSLDVLFSFVPGGPIGVKAEDISLSSGIHASGATRMHGMAFGDYDGDGDIDVYTNNGGPSTLPTTKQGNNLWRNAGNANNWTALNLVGVLSPRTPAGARSVATTNTGRRVERYLCIGRGFGNTPAIEQHYGLGTDTGVDRIDITWPSGVRQVVLQPAVGARQTVVETGMRLTGDPTPGSAVTIECCGPASEQISLWASLGTTSLTLPQFGGLLELAPPLVALGTLSLDAAGRLDLPVVVPNDPLLTGVSVYLQAWVRPAGATTGGVLTRLLTITVE
jgi:hypothetical protein